MKKKIFNIIQYFRMLSVSITEFRRFKKKCSEKENLELLMLLHCHSLEKGMVFKNIKQGYGKKKAFALLVYLNRYFELGYTGYVLDETISVLDEYIQFSDGNDAEIAEIKLQYKKLTENIVDYVKVPSGRVEYNKEYFASWRGDIPEKFFESRKSIRNFEDKCVESKDIERAVSMARYAPSACNRQPVKIYYTQKKCIIDKIDDIVMGNKGFEKETKNYLVVTSDTSLFGYAEVYQWYVNGGIFISHLIMALHSIGIGSCVFQWTQKNKREKELRQLLPIGKNEVVIAIVGIGYYPEVAVCAQATRKPLSDILIEI